MSHAIHLDQSGRPHKHDARAVGRILREHGLSLVLVSLFLTFMAGQTITGLRVYNDELREKGQAPVTFGRYLTSGHFIESTAENWESEFLQMGAFVLLTAYLFQKGSPESRDPYEAPDDPPVTKDSPWPARRGGWIKSIYSFSLTLAFAALFVGSFFMHALGGSKSYSQERALRGEPAVSMFDYMETSRFWFESFQNWQSEFLAIAAMVILAIFLRQRGSPESKAVATPNWQNE